MSGTLQASKHHPDSSVHKVRKGEIAARIARDNGLSLDQLAALNPGLDLKKLAIGTAVKISGDRTPVRAAARNRKHAAPLEAVEALPKTPLLGPASLVHLERILPSDVRQLAPAEAEPTDRSATGAASAPALAELRSVVPDGDPTEDLNATPLTGPLAFDAADPAKLDLLWPVETRTVSSAWGPRMRTRTVKVKQRKKKMRYRGSHKGVDFSAPKGTTVFAALDGQVVACGRKKDYGNFVILDHGNGVMTVYGHHNRNFVKVGDVVQRGQKIAEVGRTGNATGPHLHFELRVDGTVRNPLPVMNETEEIPAELVARNHAAVAPRTKR
jgi:murein DD-endopeptidase MepM/ murein hydrolase activator NlpD